jgi:hypothetical protein
LVSALFAFSEASASSFFFCFAATTKSFMRSVVARISLAQNIAALAATAAAYENRAIGLIESSYGTQSNSSTLTCAASGLL